jgi:transposase
VEKVYIDTNRNVLRIMIKESDDFIRGLTCEKCGGAMEVFDHESPRVWSYPATLGHDTEIGCSLPKLRCKKCGDIPQVLPVKLPWAEKGKLIEKPRAAASISGWSTPGDPGHLVAVGDWRSAMREAF